jgi:hypothetical protein
MTGGIGAFVAMVTTLLQGVIGWVKDVFGFCISEEVLPFFVFTIGISVFFVGVKAVKSITWGH